MRYRLRTLLIVMALGPPLIAYPAEFTGLAAIVGLSGLGAAVGGIFGKAIEGGILAFAFLLLLALLLPASMGSRQSPTASARIEVFQLEQAIKSYQTKVGDLPADLESLYKPPRNLPANTTWGGPYYDVDKFPTDPWGNKFEYQILDRANGKFRVWSRGPDRRPQSADDISN